MKTSSEEGVATTLSENKWAAEPKKILGLTIPQCLALIGPAFVAGAWRFGPGALTSAVQAGSQFGYALLWVLVVSTILMFVFNDMAVRIGLATDDSLVQTTKRTLGKPFGVLAGFAVFGITLMFAVGNAVGSGLALKMLFGGSMVGWTLACTVAVGILIALPNTYKIMERLLVTLIALMSVGFLASAVLTDPDWSLVAAGFIPQIPPEAGFLLIAIVGTNFSINSAFYTGYAIRERGLTPSQYRSVTLADTIPGNVATGVMAMLIIIVSAAVFNASGIEVRTFPQLAQVLEPVAGKIGSVLFGMGFFAAAFSSMAANASAGGTLLADGLGWDNKLSSPRVKVLVYVILAWGAAVTILAQGSPIQLIIVAQAMTVMAAPFLGILLFVLSSRRDVVGELCNRPWQKVLGVIGLIAIFSLSIRLIVKLFS